MKDAIPTREMCPHCGQPMPEQENLVLTGGSAPVPVVYIPMLNGKEYPVSDDVVKEFAAAYPIVNVVEELRKMRVWCIANPRKRKTSNGMKRFINVWLERAQNRGGNGNHGNSPNWVAEREQMARVTGRRV